MKYPVVWEDSICGNALDEPRWKKKKFDHKLTTFLEDIFNAEHIFASSRV